MVKTWCILLALFACSLAWETAAGKGPTSEVDNRSPQMKMVAALRARGPEGLPEALRGFDLLQSEIGKLQEQLPRLCASTESQTELTAVSQRIAELERRAEAWREAIDQIGGQRSCTVSRLYWYTDLQQAKAAAEQTGRPILSLRMLGKLTDEYSCANSRFFRTALYSNKEISDYLRDHFVLHWQSVRPVPRVTIDFGDGRKLERTLTGNSAHYLLTSAGQPLDALPGLYGPQAFREWLERTNQFHGEYLAAGDSQRPDILAEFHRQRRADVYRQWVRDVEQLGGHPTSFVMSRIDSAIQLAYVTGNETPLAAAAARIAETKTQAETPLLRFANYSGPWIEHGMDDELWQAIARLHREDVKLDETSVALMRREFPAAAVAGRISVTKSVQEDPVLRMVRLFENSMTLDTVRNEYLLHRRIHEQFADGATQTADVDALNEWIYAELFLTPSSDLWLGLAPRDVYTALENDGRTEPAAEALSRSGD